MYVKDTIAKLNHRVEDLEDVRMVMSVLKEVCAPIPPSSILQFCKVAGMHMGLSLQVREKEGDLDAIIGPIEEMYALLRRYDVRIPVEEMDGVSDLRGSWKRVHDAASAAATTLSQLQARHSCTPCQHENTSHLS